MIGSMRLVLVASYRFITTRLQFKSTSNYGSVAEQLGNNRSEMIQKNHHYIKTVAEIVVLCSQQDIALRGHDESNQSLNKGNFKELLSLVSNHDTVVAKKLQEMLSHNTE